MKYKISKEILGHWMVYIISYIDSEGNIKFLFESIPNKVETILLFKGIVIKEEGGKNEVDLPEDVFKLIKGYFHTWDELNRTL